MVARQDRNCRTFHLALTNRNVRRTVVCFHPGPQSPKTAVNGDSPLERDCYSLLSDCVKQMSEPIPILVLIGHIGAGSRRRFGPIMGHARIGAAFFNSMPYHEWNTDSDSANA